MYNLKGCFSHQSDHWATPKKIYDDFMKHGFFDPCPLHADFDGLNIPWKNLNFVNPPYSEIDKWVDKALLENEKGNYIVMLLPVRTDTKWFKKLSDFGVFIHFIKGCLHFNESKVGAPFPSMIVWLNTISPGRFCVSEEYSYGNR